MFGLEAFILLNGSSERVPLLCCDSTFVIRMFYTKACLLGRQGDFRGIQDFWNLVLNPPNSPSEGITTWL